MHRCLQGDQSISTGVTGTQGHIKVHMQFITRILQAAESHKRLL